MGHVTVTLIGRAYRLKCEDGEEPRLLALAAHIKARIDQLVADIGRAGDERLLVMAALLLADENFELKDELASLKGQPAHARALDPSATRTTK